MNVPKFRHRLEHLTNNKSIYSPFANGEHVFREHVAHLPEVIGPWYPTSDGFSLLRIIDKQPLLYIYMYQQYNGTVSITGKLVPNFTLAYVKPNLKGKPVTLIEKIHLPLICTK